MMVVLISHAWRAGFANLLEFLHAHEYRQAGATAAADGRSTRKF
jgi:hypothetical protein